MKMQLQAKPNLQTNVTVSQGCQIFFAAYGQNHDKKWPKWLFLKM